jgi:hypothetical protein
MTIQDLQDQITQLTTMTAELVQDIVLIKAQTDQLRFTIANQLDVNARSINDGGLKGNGKTIPMSAV